MPARSSASLDPAAIESARALSKAVASAALDAGLLAALDQPRTPEGLLAHCGFHPAKLATLTAVLDIMTEQGLVECRTVDGVRVYRAGRTGHAAFDRRRVDRAAVAAWLPDAHLDRVFESQRAFLGPDLAYLRRPGGQFTFDAANLDAWRANLRNPLYDFARLFAVRALAAPGRRYLDLASGIGLGTHQLAEWSDWSCDITAVDKSDYFIAVSRRLVYPATARVRHIVQDLNDGLPPAPAGSVDGVLLCGALHYIRDKDRLFTDLWRALRPLGRLAIGMCFVRDNRPDQAANEYMFSIAGERSWIVRRRDLLDGLGRAGFAVVDELHRGSQYSVVVERPAGTA
jgi:SAM-dependent methyltransferase